MRLYYQVGPVAYTFEITEPASVLEASVKLRRMFEGELPPPELAPYLQREPEDKPDPKSKVVTVKATDVVGSKIEVKPAPAPRTRS